MMPFSPEERSALLSVKGVSATVIKRFEEVGIESLAQLSGYEPTEVADMVAAMLGTTCWKNSPQARLAIESAIALARAKSS